VICDLAASQHAGVDDAADAALVAGFANAVRQWRAATGRTSSDLKTLREAVWSYWELPRLPKPLIRGKYPTSVPWSRAARERYRSGARGGLVIEHGIPMTLLLQRLLALPQLNADAARQLLAQARPHAVITEEENRALAAAGVATGEPAGGSESGDLFARYRHAGLEVDGFRSLAAEVLESSSETARDWREQPVELVRSRGGVKAVVDAKRNVMLAPGQQWPPPELKRKLGGGRGATAFDEPARQLLTAGLGCKYCRLQSLHSEDAVTWSFFGTLLGAHVATRAACLNWLMAQAQLPQTENASCEISLWKHLSAPGWKKGGRSELDACLLGEQVVVFAEAKWRSPEGTGQGKAKETQLEIRRRWFREFGTDRYGPRAQVVLGLYWKTPVEPESPPDTAQLFTRQLSWAALANCPHHPQRHEFARYLKWRGAHSQA
jgi:hypothetical protein